MRSYAVLVVLVAAAEAAVPRGSRQHPPGQELSTPQLIEAQGYPAEIHHVTTEDGYVLELHRIPHGINDAPSAGRPVAFLQHGLLCSSSDWIMNTPDKAFAYMMADAGYDVWMGNFRGNTYSRKHVTLDPDDGVAFWAFSWNEMGYYDLPAMIDYALQTTGQPDLYYVGFSMGTTTYFVLMSERPEYSSKVRVMAAMGPAAYMEHAKGAFAFMAPYIDNIDLILTMLGKGEMFPSRNVTDELLVLLCDNEAATAELCYTFIFIIAGPDSELLNTEYLPLMLAHTPAGTSAHTLNHFAQLMLSAKFRKYDYGLLGNQNHYGQSTPPDYPLANVATPVGLFWGANDWLATPEDIVRLSEELPNVVQNFRVNYDNFTHVDFIWAITADELVYKPVMALLEQY